MKYKDLKNKLDKISISPYSLCNMFTTEYKNGKYQFLLNKTLIIKGSANARSELFIKHKFSYGDQWSLLSQKFYDTTDLWWVICKFNGISNPFILPSVGTTIKIPSRDLVDTILEAIGRHE